MGYNVWLQWLQLFNFELSGCHLAPYPSKVFNCSYEYPPLIVSQDGKLPAATLKLDLHPQQEYQF